MTEIHIKYLKKMTEELVLIKSNVDQLLELNIAHFIFSLLIKIIYDDLKKENSLDNIKVFTEIMVMKIIKNLVSSY